MELNSRVHFSESTTASARHADVLASLDSVEKKLVEVLRTAAAAMSHVTPQSSADESSAAAFNKSSGDFLQLVREIHAELAGHIHLVTDYRPYGRSTYGAEKDADITRNKVQVIQEQLQSLSRYLDEHGAVMETTSIP